MKKLKNKPCPECRAKGGDKTGDHLFHVKGKHGYVNMFSCRKCTHREHIDGEKISPEPGFTDGYLLGRIAEIRSLDSIGDRGIPQAIRERYGVKSEISEVTGDIVTHYYPRTAKGDIVNYKVRNITPKSFTKLLKGIKDSELFGMKSLRGTPRTVLITEGEEDAMAAHFMLSGKVFNIACLSLPDGSGSMSSVGESLDFLSKMDRVYFCPDQDEEGQKAIDKIVSLLPDIKILKDLSEKDANEMLIQKKHKEFLNSFNRAEKYSPPFLVEVKDVIDDACKLPEWGRLWPWPRMNKNTFGMRDGEGLYLGAGVKIGKSEFINELVLSRTLAEDSDIPAVIKFEEMPAMTVKKLAGKIDRTFYHRPDLSFDPKDLRKTVESLKGKLFMYKAFGQADWDTIKYYIRYCVSMGSKTIILDPITKLTNHLTSRDTETALRRLSDDLACMAHDLGFFYVVTCHLKSPTHGIPHERGGAVMSNQFRGSRAMMENCYYMLGIERNKDPDLPDDERNTSTFVLLEDRSFGNADRFKVFYNKESGSYEEKAVTVTHLGE